MFIIIKGDTVDHVYNKIMIEDESNTVVQDL